MHRRPLASYCVSDRSIMQRKEKRGLSVLLLAAVGIIICRCWQPTFVPPAAGQNQLRTPDVRSPDLPQSAVALAGLAPLVLAPEASVAQGWETAVMLPLELINTGLNLFKTALGIYALMSWLYAFGIIDMRNDIVMKVQGALSSVIDPVLNPLRSVIPPLGGFDISFMILWFVIEQAQAAAVTIMFGADSWRDGQLEFPSTPLGQAFGLASGEIFQYNRENFQFDNEQRISKDALGWHQLVQRYKMQVERFELFREDIEDLVKLTVDKMGRIMGKTPPSYIAVYFMAVGSGWLYLLMTVWLSMLYGISSSLQDFEQQGFQKALSMTPRRRSRAVAGYIVPSCWARASAGRPIAGALRCPSGDRALRRGGSMSSTGSEEQLALDASVVTTQHINEHEESPDLGRGYSGDNFHGARESICNATDYATAAACHAEYVYIELAMRWARGDSDPDAMLLINPKLDLKPVFHEAFRKDLRKDDNKGETSAPAQHVQMFRKLQSMPGTSHWWQCFDAYARVSMSLGVHQIVQAINLFVLGLTLVETHCPSVAIAITLTLQVAFSLTFMDVASLHRWQWVGIPGSQVVESAAGSARYQCRNAGDFKRAWNFSAKPTDEIMSLPRRFRAVLFTDVFGDSSYELRKQLKGACCHHTDPTDAEHALPPEPGRPGQMKRMAQVRAQLSECTGPEPMKYRFFLQDKALATCDNLSAMAQMALRRWEALPQPHLSDEDQAVLEQKRKEYTLSRKAP
ncbi:hypothetical protein AK812_SmicGene9745 [Symbiodinium microadriaticum]|uniref:Uncharacterized protein n=1 Tax=Symbiodinium microadriaticum TaxID=2951 RepID=A0A1Q9EHT0_SYMMI|nr:hypothetical protein AK812_SmicGene9745 [Symbiodinium microadriaticum]